jgi:hypothetical protein
MTDTPVPLANFHKTPVITRGPYDYHLATPEELATGWDEIGGNPDEKKKSASTAPATKKKD